MAGQVSNAATHPNPSRSVANAPPAPTGTSYSLAEKRRLEEIKAAARAYALSSACTNSRRKGRKGKRGGAMAAIHALNPFAADPVVASTGTIIPHPYARRGRPPGALTVLPPPPPGARSSRTHPSVPSYSSDSSRVPPQQPTTTVPCPTSVGTTASLTTSTHPAPPSPSDSSNDAEPDKDSDDYELFVKRLGWNDDWIKLMDASTSFAEGEDDDEEEEFQLDDMEDEDDDDDDDHHDSSTRREGQQTAAYKSVHPESPNETVVSAHTSVAGTELDLEDWEKDFYQELEEELGWLEEEDMEAAVATLLENQPKRIEPDEKLCGSSKPAEDIKEADEEEKELPFARGTASRTRLTRKQYDQLQELLQKHYQLLLQQSVLATRTAHFQRLACDGARDPNATPIQGSETLDDLAEILDGAVGMLQDLDQNRKDSIRHHIQFSDTTGGHANVISTVPRRALWAKMDTSSTNDNNAAILSPGERRLTRSQFSRTLHERDRGEGLTVFAIPGINKLNETFSFIDKSVDGLKNGNILAVPSHSAACEQLLQHAGAVYTSDFIPGIKDLSEHFTDPKDYLGDDFRPPCNEGQEATLHRDRNMFTSGEDNLVLRGVNLYGERQWLLITDRFLPDRSTNIVSQRYSKICVLLYKAHGTKIDDVGNLETPPQFESLDDIDEATLAEAKKVDPPAILNVHRWSLEEDLSLLKAVSIMGHMWAEIAARVLPHRDRGHLRKRYQVLERRVKASVQRSSKIVAKVKNSQCSSPNKTPPNCSPKKTPPNRKTLDSSPKQSLPTQSPCKVRLSQSPKPSIPNSRSTATIVAPTGPSPRKDMGASNSIGAINQAAAILASARKAPVQRVPVNPRLTITKTYMPAPPPRVNPSTVLHRTSAHTVKVASIPAAPPVTKAYSTPSRVNLHSYPISFCIRQATTPKMSPTGLLGPTDEGSRAAFERLAGDESPGCSRIVRIKKMIEKGDCDEAGTMTTANTMVTQLAKTPGRPSCLKGNDTSVDFFAQINADNDPSGLSVLRSELGPSPDKATREADDCDAHQRAAQSVSFLAGVLERTRRGKSGTEPLTGRLPQGKNPGTGTAQPDPTSLSRNLSTSHRGIRPTSAHQSTSSPTASGSGLVADPTFGLPPLFSPTLPETNLTFGSFPPLHSPPTMSCSTGWHAPPLHDGHSAYHQVLPLNSQPQAPSAAIGNLPGAGLSNIGWSENSPPSQTPTSKNSSSTPQQCFFGDGSTLMETDLEIISALNSLSHSPAAGDAFKKQEKRPVEATKSLFAKVVGETAAATNAPSAKKRKLCF